MQLCYVEGGVGDPFRLSGPIRQMMHGVAYCDVMPANARVLAPSQNSIRCYFRSIVADNHVQLAMPTGQMIQFAGHSCT